MRKRHYVLVVLLSAVALASAWALIPRGPELALMRLKDKQYEAARRDYESQLAAGDHSTSLVGALTTLYLQYGEIDAAIRLMERYVREHPRDLSARRKLGTYYQYSQRPDLYLANLERITEAKPNEEDLRELARGYNFLGRHENQARVLGRLINLGWGQQSDYLDAANLLGAQGKFAEGAALLTAWIGRAPVEVDISFIEFLGRLLEDAGKPEEAYRQAAAWLERHQTLDGAGRLGEMLHFYKRPDLAVRLLTPFSDKAQDSPRLLACLTQAEVDTGQRERAFARLDQLRQSRRLDSSLLEAYVDLALQLRRTELALEAAGLAGALPTDQLDYSLRALPDWLLGNLAEAATLAHRVDAVIRMRDMLGDGFLADRPLLAAEIALGQGDMAEAARWADAAAEKIRVGGWSSGSEPAALADLLVRMNRSAEAVVVLEHVATKGRAGDDVLVALSQLYREIGRAPEVFDRFASWVARDGSPRAESAWALLAAAAGRDGELSAWMRSVSSRRLDEDTLKNISHLAGDRGGRDIQVQAAELLWSRFPRSSNRLILAEALVAAERPEAALEHLRPLTESGPPEAQAVYSQALLAAARGGADVRDELRQYVAGRLSVESAGDAEREELIRALVDTKNWETALPDLSRLARSKGGPWFWVYLEALEALSLRTEAISFLSGELGRGDLPDEEMKIRMTALLERGGATEALPVLRRWAEDSGGEWLSALEETLTGLGRKSDFSKTLAARIQRPGTTPAERRELAWRLLEAGDKKTAEATFLELAREAPAGHRDVAQLLYLWGPRPPERALVWMEARARGSVGAERAAWMGHLINVGAARRAAGVSLPEHPTQEEVTAMVKALQGSRDIVALTKLIDTGVAVASSAEQLRTWARLAAEESLHPQMSAAYYKILERVPSDREAMVRLGKLAFAEGRYKPARELLDGALASGERDWECYGLMGDLLARERRSTEARKAYHEALALVAAQRNRPYPLRAAEALLLHKSRRETEARAAFEKLLAERPDDANLKADYAAVLMEGGRYESAEQILARH